MPAPASPELASSARRALTPDHGGSPLHAPGGGPKDGDFIAVRTLEGATLYLAVEGGALAVRIGWPNATTYGGRAATLDARGAAFLVPFLTGFAGRRAQ